MKHHFFLTIPHQGFQKIFSRTSGLRNVFIFFNKKVSRTGQTTRVGEFDTIDEGKGLGEWVEPCDKN